MVGYFLGPLNVLILIYFNSDFGFTREMPSSNSEIDSLSAVGTDLWAAPEVLTDQPYGPSADVFSFAMVIFYSLLSVSLSSLSLFCTFPPPNTPINLTFLFVKNR